MRKAIILLLLFSTTGCGYAHRHPVRTKVAIISAGVGFGVLAGLKTRGVFCPTTINGYSYKGTAPCPGPNYEPGRSH